MTPLPRFCTISTVKNGWLVQTSPPNCCSNELHRDDLLVFASVDRLGLWVEDYFGVDAQTALPTESGGLTEKQVATLK